MGVGVGVGHRRSRSRLTFGEPERLFPAGEMGDGGTRRASEVPRRMHRAAPLTTPLTKGPNTCGSQYASKRRRAPPGARAAALPAGSVRHDGPPGDSSVLSSLPSIARDLRRSLLGQGDASRLESLDPAVGRTSESALTSSSAAAPGTPLKAAWSMLSGSAPAYIVIRRAPSAFMPTGVGRECCGDDAVDALVSCRSTHALNRSTNASIDSTANAAACSETFGSKPKPSSRNACGRVICPLRSSACSSCIVSALLLAMRTRSGLEFRAVASSSRSGIGPLRGFGP